MNPLQLLFGTKPKPAPVDYSVLGADMHSHLIPGIDDGAQTMAEALDLIRDLHALGFRKLITTPHVMAARYPNSRECILGGLERLRAAVEDAGIDMELHAAAEYMLDEHFSELLDAGDLLTLDGQQVLIEMGYVQAAPDLRQMIFLMQAKGYIPVLAHPERYGYLKGDVDAYYWLIEKGCRFQVNIMSLIGHYGRGPRKTSRRLMKSGLVDFLGTDLHHHQHVEILHLALQDPWVQQLLVEGGFRNKEL
jgi:protein-tyrosine phosphatase